MGGAPVRSNISDMTLHCWASFAAAALSWRSVVSVGYLCSANKNAAPV